VIVKALGVGMALAVLLDATLVRGLLVPATMRLLGNVNWWWPWPFNQLLPGVVFREVGAASASESADAGAGATAAHSALPVGGER
jgi:RND superfamily putative drug exporter